MQAVASQCTHTCIHESSSHDTDKVARYTPADLDGPPGMPEKAWHISKHLMSMSAKYCVLLRSAARKTRRKKCENLMELEQEVMLLGQQNSSLIYDLNNIIAQVEHSLTLADIDSNGYVGYFVYEAINVAWSWLSII